ncbi:LOW QUALITY PROTEIN: glypican-6-like [Lethenteron reissneri]|uniref:LOW QUALITY PROTEIN: glypican-6-like n=1 Tax=Lethenteron reissneri TaxID=7753 RepID=UPI002AB6E55C|nr:LOW QUALITY PROTEIN: glypican-6-like [Lethenteron reissneri]
MTRHCVVGLLWALISAGSCLGADQPSCPTFRRVTNQGAAGAVEVLARPVPGHHLSVCRPRALSCCSRSVEAQLGPAARLDLQRLVEESSHFPLAAFQLQYSKMDDYMGDLLRRAEASLHDMFVRSYGVIYTQNADLFLWLFSQLRLYAGVSAPPPPAPPPPPPHRRPPGGPPPESRRSRRGSDADAGTGGRGQRDAVPLADRGGRSPGAGGRRGEEGSRRADDGGRPEPDGRTRRRERREAPNIHPRGSEAERTLGEGRADEASSGARATVALQPSPWEPSSRETLSREPSPQEPSPREPSSCEPSAREMLSRDPSPREPSSREMLSRDPSPREPLLREPSSRETSPPEPSPREPSSRDPSSREPSSREPSPRQPSSRGAVQDARIQAPIFISLSSSPSPPSASSSSFSSTASLSSSSPPPPSSSSLSSSSSSSPPPPPLSFVSLSSSSSPPPSSSSSSTSPLPPPPPSSSSSPSSSSPLPPSFLSLSSSSSPLPPPPSFLSLSSSSSPLPPPPSFLSPPPPSSPSSPSPLPPPPPSSSSSHSLTPSSLLSSSSRATAAVDLAEVMSEFWSQLLERMLQLLNPQYRFSDGDLECAVKLAESLRPFGAAPRKLLAQLGRAALATRSLTRGLRLAAGVANATRTAPLSAECVRSLVRMWYCPYCGGATAAALPPCHAYCLNVLKGCLAHTADMDAAWNSFIDAMLQLTERLEGPFNVETVLAPIDVRISDAIMHLQENSVQVSTQIFAECGIPNPGRAHQAGRGAAPSGYGGRGRVGTSRPPAPTASPSTTIVHLVREARDTLRRMKSFWASLPFSVCSAEGVAADISSEERCWNGEGEGRYLRDVVGDGLAQQRDNPEVKVDVTRPDLQSRRQIMALRVMTSQLHGAFHGHDTHFADSSDEWGSGSGDCGGEDASCPRPAEPPPRTSLTPSSGGRAHDGSPSRAPPPASSSRSALGLLSAALAAMLRRLQ